MPNKQQYEWNRAALLPPVGCPLVIYIDGQIYQAERTNHLTDKAGQMEYQLGGGQVIRGRFEWSYP